MAAGLFCGLNRPDLERDSCGFGLIAHLNGEPSHELVRTALASLHRLTHRGAIHPDGKTGDGCGLLLTFPEPFFRRVARDLGFALAERFAVGTVFLGQGGGRAALDQGLLRAGLKVSGWRRVPVDPEVCGEDALKTLPEVWQVFVNAPTGIDGEAFERRLFMARRRAEQAMAADPDFYVVSLSSRLVGYKGLVTPANLARFYPDLDDPRFASCLCLFHQRFSTNTLPRWRLAQPFRRLAHNGEINTLKGNRAWALARGPRLKTSLLPELDEVLPLVDPEGSDSMSLDSLVEALALGGMGILQAVRLLVPPAWENDPTLDPDLRAFYEYHALSLEPWDGPAALALTDGRYGVCATDRNGLRPAHYVVTDNRWVTFASEIGVYDYPPAAVVAKGRLGPGQMIAVDLQSGRLLLPQEAGAQLAGRRPYRWWLERHVGYLEPEEGEAPPLPEPALKVYEKQFLVTLEERSQVLRVLAEAGQEAIGSMGDDTPLPVLSRTQRPLYDSFRQQFAQVTNPPIDPLREAIVMSLRTVIGRQPNPLAELPAQGEWVWVDSPVLSCGQFSRLLEIPELPAAIIDLTYPAEATLALALERIAAEAVQRVREGKSILVLSDRAIAKDRLPAHALLAVGAVHHRLIDAGLRCDADLVVETATARDPHHLACLIGCGATAVHPYLAYHLLAAMVAGGEIAGPVSEVLERYRRGIDKGLYKILSKMGISTVAAYRGAQLFEAVGLAAEVVERCFQGLPSRLGGMGFAELEENMRALWREAWNPGKPVRLGGFLKYVEGGEDHAWSPAVVTALHRAVRSGKQSDYQAFADLVNRRPPAVLRDLLGLRESPAPVPLAEVEPVAAIVARFDTAAMSLGAISPEAHEALAIAMNRLGGRSNSGEGGEDPARYGTAKNSKIKQVASARFGVTPAYLTSAEVLQIKIAQGAKPGEGGQLPGQKVGEYIAKLRHCRPGTPLISPPPHHDIYSIEDLAQLIFDLKQVNPKAQVSVKLVAGPGVGTIACGVAKAYADLITIAGYDGGTGASPLSSVKYAGLPWELGLVETHQMLRANGLRDRVRLQADGGLKTGLDVVKAACLGAESFGFGTAPLVALGCKYLRICHLNNCATGVATQHELLRRKHFAGLPEMVETYFRCLAEEVRQYLAALGARSLVEIVGRSDLLTILPGETERQRRLDLEVLLAEPEEARGRPRSCQVPRNAPFDKGELAETMVQDMLPAIEARRGGQWCYAVRNTHRSIGARVSGEIARRHGDAGPEDAPLVVRCYGTAGQSFGAFNAGGLHLYLEGDANDYVGKGMAGGKIVLRPPPASRFAAHRTPIMGNTCLYGATGGKLFAAGTAGERFAVRNSGAVAVVEGVGDHGCEYMTGGVVVILGPAGPNFGAGMTGGIAYVLDLEGGFPDRLNPELVDHHRVDTAATEAHAHHLRRLIGEFVAEAASPWGYRILEDWGRFGPRFWLVKPKTLALETLLELDRAAA